MDSYGMDFQKVLDASKKDSAWMTTSISQLRRNWSNLIDPNRAAQNRRIILSQQSLDKIKAQFKDKAFVKCTEWVPVAIWPRIVNILVEELRKIPPSVELKANDSTAISDRKEDILLLQYRAAHEAAINKLSQKVGDNVPYIIPEDKFKTQIDEFQRLGLDPTDPEDIEFMAKRGYQRLRYEIAGQKLLNVIFKLNRFDEETLNDAVLDLLSTLDFCVQAYVDEITGEIKYERIYPEEAYGIFGEKRDGSDDICKGFQKNLTLRDWLGRVGNEFVFERDWPQLLWALNYANNYKYTGFIRNGFYYDATNPQFGLNYTDYGITAGQPNMLDWNIAYTYKIYTGYIEFTSIDATATYLSKVGTGEIIPHQVDYNFFLGNKEETKEYQKESFYNEQMYKSYFLVTSSTSQWIYNWGKLYYQQLYGAYDQYAKGSLIFYRLEGIPPAEISKYYIDMANLAAYRLKWLVYKAKPQSEEYVISELIKVSKAMQRMMPQNDKSKAPSIDNILTQIIEYMHQNTVILRDYPEIEGKTYPVLNPLSGTSPKGADPIALWLQAIEMWAENQIAEKIGLNDIRLGQNENDRASFKTNSAETQSSYNSTGYLFRVPLYVKEHLAEMTLNYTQDIIRFKDTIPYKWIQKLLGEEEFANLAVLGDYSSHRYAILVENYNSFLQKQKVLQAADVALNARDGAAGINIMEWALINKTDDYKDAFRLLDTYQYLEQKKLRKQKLQEYQIEQNNVMQQKGADLQLAQTQDNAMLQGKQIDADAIKYSADKSAESKVQVKELQNQAEAPKQQAKSSAEQDVLDKEAQLKQQESLAVQ